MSQSHGRVPFAKPVDLSYKVDTGVLVPVPVSQGDPFVDTSWPTPRMNFHDSLPKAEREREWGEYYGAKANEQILGEGLDKPTRLQQTVQELASKYISADGRDVVSRKDKGHP